MSLRLRPAGGGGVYHNWGYGGLNPHHYYKAVHIYTKNLVQQSFLYSPFPRVIMVNYHE